MKKEKLILMLSLVLMAGSSIAQNNLNNYILQGLANNESIKQQEFILNKNKYAIQEAKSLFLPAVNFNATYTLAEGGRSVDFPVGDLLNPVYTSLNQLTAGSPFPQLKNQSILLNPDNFYDVKVRTTYPLFNPELTYNKKIKNQEYDVQKNDLAIYKRELAREIKTAYYQYLQAEAAIEIYENALLLVKENDRINNSLFNNQKINRTAVVRSTNEVTKVTAQLNMAIQNAENVQSLFNFLINQPLSSPIKIDTIRTLPAFSIITDTSVSRREELLKLAVVSAINRNLIGLEKTYKTPRLNSFFDVGTQGFDFGINNKSPYYFFGLSLEWTLFSGGKHKYKVKQAEANLKISESQKNYVDQQLALQLKTAINSFRAVVNSYQAAVSQVAASEKYYKDVLRLYKEGTTLYIELLDAQYQLIDARLQQNILLYETWIKQADIERSNAGLNLQ